MILAFFPFALLSFHATGSLYPIEGSQEVIGKSSVFHQVSERETLLDVARDFDLGFEAIRRANPAINLWQPQQGVPARLPVQHLLPVALLGDNPTQIVINLPEFRLYHRISNNRIATYPVGIGREGAETPLGKMHIVQKRKDPAWTVPASIRREDPTLPAVVPPGPLNPLGKYALTLSFPGYLIHGTNKPYGIGRRISHGCIRLYPEDIVDLYAHTQKGEQVLIVRHHAKAGWLNHRTLLLEVHPGNMPDNSDPYQTLLAEATMAIRNALTRRPTLYVALDWTAVEHITRQADGMPHPVTMPLDF